MKKIISLFIFFIFLNFSSFCQPLPPDDDCPDCEVPIDGGIIFAFVGAFIFGVKKIKQY